jgi:hypothetical protein
MEHLLLLSKQNPLAVEAIDSSMTEKAQTRCIQQLEMKRSAALLLGDAVGHSTERWVYLPISG